MSADFVPGKNDEYAREGYLSDEFVPEHVEKLVAGKLCLPAGAVPEKVRHVVADERCPLIAQGMMGSAEPDSPHHLSESAEEVCLSVESAPAKVR